MTMFKKFKILFNMVLMEFRIKRNSNDQILTSLRKKIHEIENKITEERTIPPNQFFYALNYFFEAKKRNLLSKDELGWCKRVLNGNKTSIETKGITRFDEGNNKRFEEVIYGRRSVRDWLPDNGEITDEEFKLLAEAVRWAPSSCNRQPWHLILTRDKNTIAFLSKIRKQKFVKKAPSCILFLVNLDAYSYSDKETILYYAYLDSGAAIQNILLMADNLGLGACWVNLAKNNISEKQKTELKDFFDIPSEYEIITLIPLGKYQEKPNSPGRKNSKSFLSWEGF